MVKTAIDVSKVAVPKGPYSIALQMNDLIFIAGRTARDANGVIVAPDLQSQARYLIELLDNLLQAANSDLSHLLKITVYLSDISTIGQFNDVYRQLIPDPKPVRTTVGVSLAPGILVEIDAIAAARG